MSKEIYINTNIPLIKTLKEIHNDLETYNSYYSAGKKLEQLIKLLENRK